MNAATICRLAAWVLSGAAGFLESKEPEKKIKLYRQQLGACQLTAEGKPGWDEERKDDGPQLRAVRELRRGMHFNARAVENLQQENVFLRNQLSASQPIPPTSPHPLHEKNSDPVPDPSWQGFT